MNILHVKDVKYISDLVRLDDDIEDFIVGDRGEWIQWLTENIRSKNEKILLLHFYEGTHLIGYMVLIDGRQRPISDCLYILFVYSKATPTKNQEMWFEFLEWIKSNHLPLEVKACTKYPSLMKQYGFTEDLELTPIKMKIT